MLGRKIIILLTLLGLSQTLLSVVKADDCNRYLRGVRNLADIDQALIEDCMRTGQAQAWTTAVIASVAGGAIAGAASQAINQANQKDTQEGPEEEAKSTKFRIRMDASAEGEAVIGVQWIRFIIQIWDDSSGTWGASQRVSFLGITGGIGAGVGITGQSRSWSTFHTQRYTRLKEIKGNAVLINYPGGDVTPIVPIALGGGFNLTINTEDEIINVDVDNTARGIHTSVNLYGRVWGRLF